MNIPKVGETTTETTLLGRRDAFHVPAVLASSGETILRGEHVAFIDSEFTYVTPSSYFDRHGIVDPFTNERMIPPGTLFWVFLIPEAVGNLAHHFDIKLNVAPVLKTVTAELLDLDDDFDDDGQCAGCYGDF